MVDFETIILQFAEQGEKTGWTYIEVPADIAQQLKPDHKRSFRVKGHLDSLAIRGLALIPMGEGNFIMALNAEIRKGIRKGKGAMLKVSVEVDNDFEIKVPEDLQQCLDDEQEAAEFFYKLPKSHRDYFIKWVDSAKTDSTRITRIANTVNAMIKKQRYNQMMRELKKLRE